jgi:hypothetical protein
MQVSFAFTDYGSKPPMEVAEICRNYRDQLAGIKAKDLPDSVRGELFKAIAEYDLMLYGE